MQEQVILTSINKEQLAQEIADKVINQIGATKPQKEDKLEYLNRKEVAGILQLSQDFKIIKSKRNNYLNVLKKHEGEQAQYETMLMYSSWQFWLSLGSKELEIQTSNLFTELGYDTSVIGGKNDGGVDIFMVDEDGNKIIVQCKAYKNIIGPNYVRELYGTLMHKKADIAILVAPRGFSYTSRDFASGKPIKLYDVDDLTKLTYNFKNYRPYELANAQSMDDVYKYVRKKTGLKYR